jgi:hypothetical protein
MLGRQPAQIPTVELARSNAHSAAMPEVAKIEHRKPCLAARDRLTFNFW